MVVARYRIELDPAQLEVCLPFQASGVIRGFIALCRGGVREDEEHRSGGVVGGAAAGERVGAVGCEGEVGEEVL